jgi:Tfp pilus assembly protein PilX
MPMLPRPSRHRRQEGGITIMVALAMLVFITLVAVGLSRNSFREVVISGSARQASMARNAADSGIEWAVYWMTAANVPSAASNSPLQFNGPDGGLLNLLLQPTTQSGVYRNLDQSLYVPGAPPAVPADLTLAGTGAGVTSGFTVATMQMGKLPMVNTNQNPGGNQYNPGSGGYSPNAPNLWAIRSDGQVTYAGAATFMQSREAWISTPIP